MPLSNAEKIAGYTDKTHDYCYEITDGLSDAFMGACEIQGKRRDQQDAIAFEHRSRALEQFPHLTVNQRKQALDNTVAEMQRCHGQHNRYGATLCSAVAWQIDHTIHVSTINIGDSAAYLVVLAEDGAVLHASRLNTLHNPHPGKNPGEYSRTGKPQDHRLNGVALSRAIGDKSAESDGLLHTPEYTDDQLNRPSLGCCAFVIVACDGLEKLVSGKRHNNISLIAQIIQQCRGDSCQKMAWALVNAAYQRGSSDNISAAVFKVQQYVTSALITDGHGYGKSAHRHGGVVSAAIAKDFYPQLARHIPIVSHSLPNEVAFCKIQDRQMAQQSHFDVQISPEWVNNFQMLSDTKKQQVLSCVGQACTTPMSCVLTWLSNDGLAHVWAVNTQSLIAYALIYDRRGAVVSRYPLTFKQGEVCEVALALPQGYCLKVLITNQTVPMKGLAFEKVFVSPTFNSQSIVQQIALNIFNAFHQPSLIIGLLDVCATPTSALTLDRCSVEPRDLYSYLATAVSHLIVGHSGELVQAAPVNNIVEKALSETKMLACLEAWCKSCGSATTMRDQLADTGYVPLTLLSDVLQTTLPGLHCYFMAKTLNLDGPLRQNLLTSLAVSADEEQLQAEDLKGNVARVITHLEKQPTTYFFWNSCHLGTHTTLKNTMTKFLCDPWQWRAIVIKQPDEGFALKIDSATVKQQFRQHLIKYQQDLLKEGEGRQSASFQRELSDLVQPKSSVRRSKHNA